MGSKPSLYALGAPIMGRGTGKLGASSRLPRGQLLHQCCESDKKSLTAGGQTGLSQCDWQVYSDEGSPDSAKSLLSL